MKILDNGFKTIDITDITEEHNVVLDCRYVLSIMNNDSAPYCWFDTIEFETLGPFTDIKSAIMSFIDYHDYVLSDFDVYDFDEVKIKIQIN